MLSVRQEARVVANVFQMATFLCSESRGRAVLDLGLRPLASWDCRFDSRGGLGCLLWVLCVRW